MPRLTRAKAAEVAEQLHIDEDAVLELHQADDENHLAGGGNLNGDDQNSILASPKRRPALVEIAQNSTRTGRAATVTFIDADDGENDDNTLIGKPTTTTTKRGGRKAGHNGGRQRSALRAKHHDDDDDAAIVAEILPDDMDAPLSPASLRAAEELLLRREEDMCAMHDMDMIREEDEHEGRTGLLQASHLPSAGENKNAGDEPDEAAAAVFLATRSLLLSPPAPAPSPNGRGSGLTSSSSSHTITTIDTPAIDGTTTNTTTTTGVKERKDSLSTTTITDDKVSPSGPFDHQVHSEMPNTMQRGTAVRSPSPARLSTPQSVKSFRTVDSGYTAGSVDRTAYDALEAAVVEAQASPCPGTPVGQVLQKEAQQPQHVEQEPEQEQQQKPASQLTSPRRPQTPEDPIQALDALEDAVERVASLVPEVPASPEKKQQPQQQQESKQNQPWTKQASIPPRATKASQARISLAHGPKDAVPKYPSLGKPRTSLGGPNDVSSARNRVTSTASDRSTGSETSGAKKEVVIPHSKPRPMSMSFPAPPPPPKSRKPPTQSTFQLPGEAVAAKFKAAKEARLAQAAEAAKPKPFKARPVPASLGMGPAVRQTSSSLARECLITGKPVEQRSVSGPAEQRTASALGAHFRSTSSTTTSRTVSRAGLSSSHSAASSSSSTATTTLTAGASSQKSQGQAPPPKEVFSRASLFELAAAAEQEQKQKEEAVKRARAEAAERSRAISREWAERQRRKKAAAMASGGATPVPV